MALQPGSLPWLMAHEMRLGWREFRGKRAVVVGIVALLLAFMALMVVRVSRFRQGLEQFAAAGALPDWAIWLAVEMVILLLAVTILQSLRAGTNALFDRGDLDLLLTSPVSSKVVFASRLQGIALNNFLGIVVFLLVPVLLFMALGFTQLWGIFPATLALSLLGTSLGVLVILLLVKQFGVRQTRTLAVFAIVPFILMMRLVSQQSDRIAALATQYPILQAQSNLWLPARAMFGNGLGLLLLWAVAIAVAWLTVEVLYGSFLGGTQESQRSTRPASRGGNWPFARTRQSAADPIEAEEASPRFTANLTRLVLMKEWRLMRRNPDLLTQLAISFIMLVPFFGSALRPDPEDQFFANILLGMVGLIAVSLTIGLANLAICGEESPTLIKVSPASSGRITVLKLAAVLIPVWVISVPLIALLLFRHYPWGWAMLLVLGASICTALLRLWNAEFIPPTAMKKRRQNPSRDPVLSALEWVSYIAWFVLGVALNVSIARLIYISLGVVVGMMVVAYFRNRALGPALDLLP
jgi:ABC-2 type transport system permease protein